MCYNGRVKEAPLDKAFLFFASLRASPDFFLAGGGQRITIGERHLTHGNAEAGADTQK